VADTERADLERDKRVSKSVAAQVGFVAVAGSVCAAIWVLGDIVRNRRTSGMDPGSLIPVANDGLGFLVVMVLLTFTSWAANVYRQRYAGRRWARDVFVAMIAVYVVSVLLDTVVVRTWSHSWGRLGLESYTGLAVGAVAAVCLVMAGVSVWATGIWVPNRVPGRPSRGAQVKRPGPTGSGDK
jgi:hypothetical protein